MIWNHNSLEYNQLGEVEERTQVKTYEIEEWFFEIQDNYY